MEKQCGFLIVNIFCWIGNFETAKNITYSTIESTFINLEKMQFRGNMTDVDWVVLVVKLSWWVAIMILCVGVALVALCYCIKGTVNTTAIPINSCNK